MKKKNRFEKFLNKPETITESSMNCNKNNKNSNQMTRNTKFIEDKKIKNKIDNKFDYFNPIYNQINLNNIDQKEKEILTQLLSENMINISKINDSEKNDIAVTGINVHKIISKILEMGKILKNPELLENYNTIKTNDNENYENIKSSNNDNNYNDYNDDYNDGKSDNNSNRKNINNGYNSQDILQKYGDDMRFFGELIKNSTDELNK